MIRKASEPGPKVESVHRALVLLARILDDGSLSVTEAAAVLDVNVSTAQRLLATLVHDGFAAQRSDRRYAIGPALDHPRLTQPAPELSARMRPALEALFERSGETVHLSALVGTHIIQVDGIEASDHSLRFGLHTGRRLPAALTAAGRAMLAELTDDELESRFAFAPDEVDLAQLREILAVVREDRVATNLEESEPGIAAMSISVGSFAGQRAALSIAVPFVRYTPAFGDIWAKDLVSIADGIARGEI